MKLTMIISILLLMFLSGCGKETTSYFVCSYGTTSPKYYSLVIDTQKKNLFFDNWKERKYEESAPNYLESKLPFGTTGGTDTVQFDTVTGRLSYLTEYTNMSGYPDGQTIRYQCKKSEKLI
jgi:hypothetical protein